MKLKLIKEGVPICPNCKEVRLTPEMDGKLEYLCCPRCYAMYQQIFIENINTLI